MAFDRSQILPVTALSDGFFVAGDEKVLTDEVEVLSAESVHTGDCGIYHSLQYSASVSYISQTTNPIPQRRSQPPKETSTHLILSPSRPQ